MLRWGFLVLGSVAGGLGRYVLAGAVYRIAGASFPYGTLAVNLSGCLLIGFLNGLAEGKFLLGPETRILLMTGFCGAFTTFSTFILESVNLAKDGEFMRMFWNLGASVILGVLVFMFGEFFAKII
jgi:CrcB protein